MSKPVTPHTLEHKSHLVQRLKKPFPSDALGRFGQNPFSFGGGLLNGGLSKEAMDLLNTAMRFDYMGAAEFEWGALPEALQAMVNVTEGLIAFGFNIPLRDVAKDFRDKSNEEPQGSATIYVICHQDVNVEVQGRITQWASEPFNSGLRESTRLSSTLRPHTQHDGDVVGWLELDNGFFFFTDRTMWEQTCALFGVDASV